jgi:hypothetical protein
VRRLHPPTLAQWGCEHRWKTTTSRPGEGDIVRVRYLTCRLCGLKVKTKERLAVPWDENDLVAHVKALLPEGEAVYLQDRGITELPLEALNAHLARRGYQIHAGQSGNVERGVACVDRAGRVRRYGLFELRRTSPAAVGGRNGKQDRQ